MTSCSSNAETQQIMSALEGIGLTLSLKGEKIKVDPPGAVQSAPAWVRTTITANRDALIEEITRQAFGGLSLLEIQQRTWSVLDDVIALCRPGQPDPALAAPQAVVDYLWDVHEGQPSEMPEALKLTSVDGKGRDTYVACLLHTHKTLCDRLERAGQEDVLYYRAPMRLLTWHMATGRPFGQTFAAASAETARALASGGAGVVGEGQGVAA